MSVRAVVAAAGSGRRMHAVQNKVLLPLCGRTVLEWTIDALCACPAIDGIVVVGATAELATVRSLLADRPRILDVVAGGDERQGSMARGLAALAEAGGRAGDLVAFHNGANCLVSTDDVDRVIEAARRHGAAVVAQPCRDTIKRVGDDGLVRETLARAELWAMQTPQVIEWALAQRAFAAAEAAGHLATDDVALVERLGEPVAVVRCSDENIKLTTPADLLFAAAVLGQRGAR